MRKWMALAFVLAACSGGSVRLSPSFVAVHNTMAAMGYAQSGEISEGSAGEGGVGRHTTRLAGGQCYTIVAFGSGGVSDIDIVVKDETGAELATDRTDDSQAAAQVCPDADGDYQIEVRMGRGGGDYLVTAWSGMAAGGGIARAGSGAGTCARPIPLPIGTSVSGDTSNGADNMTGSCIQGGAAPEIVYSITVESRAQLTVVMTSDFDGALYLLGACGELRSEIACNDDAPSTTRSEIQAQVDPGTYFLAVDGYGSASGRYDVQATITDLASIGQVCQQAAQLTAGQAVTGSTRGQPGYFTATCAGGARSPDRVYTLDVPSRSRMRLRMQSNYDGAIYVRRDCQNPNSELACNDDHRDTQHSMLVTTLDQGRYYIFADGFSNNQAGDYSLRADLAPLTGGSTPADACAAPGNLAPGQDAVLDTFPASDDYAGSCGGQGAPDVVYQIDLQNRVRLRARLADSEFQAAMYIQRTCGQANTEVVCSSAAGPGGTELEATLTPGTYFLVVDGVAADQFGAARVELQLDDLAALERACNTAPRLRPGATVTGDTSSSSDRFQATCAENARSSDLVYRLVLTRRSRVTISSEQQYDGAIYIRRDCTDQSTELACNDDAQDNRHSLVETELDRGTYYVFVDGFSNNNQGSFRMTVDVARAAAGGAPPPPQP